MYIRDIYKNNDFVLSFEIFPPKKDYNLEKLYKTIEELKSLKPGFVSVTYGAGGSTREKTIEIASKIKNEMNIETLSHFTCVNSTQNTIKDVLDELKKLNIENILALRGDPPQGQKNFTKTINGFGYASELINFIKNHGDWSVAVAGYPQGHPDSPDPDTDIEYLKQKVDSGADLIITQLFFDNNFFYDYRNRAVKKGINIPIVPGIFPILNFNGINKIISLGKITIPRELYNMLEKYKDSKEDTERIGIDYAIKQSEDLINNNIPGIHYYTMNKSRQIKKILDAVNSK